MPIVTLPLVAEFGGVKTDRYAEESATQQLAATPYNALAQRVIDAFSAIGLDDGSTAGSLRAAILAITSGTVGSVQIVSTSTATITTARHVIVTYSGATCTLTLPDAAAAKEITVWKGNGIATDIVLARSAGDTASGTINGIVGSFTCELGYFGDVEGARFDIVGQAALTWLVSSEWIAIEEVRSSLLGQVTAISDAITAVGIGGIVVSTASGTVTIELDVYVTATDAAVDITLPDASEGRRIRIHKTNDQATQTINLVRSAGDVGGGGTINGSAGTRSIVCTSLAANERRRSWVAAGVAALEWNVDDGEHRELAQHETRIGDLESFDTTAAGRLTTLEAAGYSAQVISATSGTITTALDVYLTNAGATLTITLPDASAGRRIRIHKANSATTQTITLVRSAGDALGEINDTAASFDIVMTGITGTRRSWIVAASAALEWHVDSGEGTAIANAVTTIASHTASIADHETRLDDLEGVVVETGTSCTVAAGTKHLILTNTGATIDVTLPDASAIASFRVYKANSATTQTINFIRSAGDTGAGTINGNVSTRTIVLTSISASATHMSWMMRGQAAGAWRLDDGLTYIATTNTTNIASVSADVTSLDGRLDTLEAGLTPAANMRRTTSGTTDTIVAGETLVCQASANAMVYTMPAAIAGRQIDIVKETTNVGTITIARAGSDTIHGSASNYVLNDSAYVTDATHVRYRWTITCFVNGEWMVT